MNQQSNFRISVKAAVFDTSGRLLLAKEHDGKWSLLGGGLNYNEHPVCGLKREVKEETGLEITVVSEAPHYFYTCKKRNKPDYSACVVYKVELESLQFTASDECTELRFFSSEEARQVPLLPHVTEFMKQLNSAHNQNDHSVSELYHGISTAVL